jgi:hypothetical protein
MTRVTGGDASNAIWQAALFYLVLPDTGVNATLKWDWIGSGASSDASLMFSVTYWKGIDTSSPVRDTDGTQGSGFPRTTPSLTAQTNDKIVAWYGGFNISTEATVDSWTNLTLLRNEITQTGGSDGAWAVGSPSGNTTVSAASGTSFASGGLCAVVLAPAGTSVSVTITAVDAMAASVGDESVSTPAPSTEVPREVGEPGMVSMGKFMGN